MAPGYWSTFTPGGRVTHVSLRAGQALDGVDIELGDGRTLTLTSASHD